MANYEEDDEVLQAKKREERRIRRALDRNAPTLHTSAEFQLHVLDDPEFLVCVWIGSSCGLCPHWGNLQGELEKIVRPKPPTVHAKHYRVDIQKCDPQVLQTLRVSELPTVVFYLKGAMTGEMRGCSNPEKLQSMYRNCLISRNQEMLEYDEAKKPKPPEEGEAEEGEEAEEAEDEDQQEE